MAFRVSCSSLELELMGLELRTACFRFAAQHAVQRRLVATTTYDITTTTMNTA